MMDHTPDNLIFFDNITNQGTNCYTLDEAQSELIESETSRTTKSKDEGKLLLSPRGEPAVCQ